MLQILYKYLILNKKAAIPGIGVFYIGRQPAYLDFSNKQFIAPSLPITFNEGAVAVEKKFYLFLSHEKQIDETEAVQHYNDFADDFRHNLDANGRVELPGFGWLSKDMSGALHFQPPTQAPLFFANVPVERIVQDVSKQSMLTEGKRKDKNHVAVSEAVESTSSKNDYWWVFAIVLAAAAIAAIVYYYNQNGNLR